MAFANDATFIGILEIFDKKDWLTQTPKDSLDPRVRIVFSKENNQWHAMKSQFKTFEELTASPQYYPNEVAWYVTNKGKILGTLSTVKYTPQWYSDVGIQQVIGSLTKNFLLPAEKQWRFPLLKMNYKPLVLVSQKKDVQDFQDTEGWVSGQLNTDEMNKIHITLQKKMKSLFSQDNIKIVESYYSKNHALLISVVTSSESSPYWFYFENPLSVQLLGQGIVPIEAADFDHDGKTEWVFLYSDLKNPDANSNGYVLFYDNFKKSARFLWSSH